MWICIAGPKLRNQTEYARTVTGPDRTRQYLFWTVSWCLLRARYYSMTANYNPCSRKKTGSVCADLGPLDVVSSYRICGRLSWSDCDAIIRILNITFLIGWKPFFPGVVYSSVSFLILYSNKFTSFLNCYDIRDRSNWKDGPRLRDFQLASRL